MFDAEVFAIYQALHAPEQRQVSGHLYTVYIDSTSATGRVRDYALSPVQRSAVAAIEDCSHIFAKHIDVTIRWVWTRSVASGNEVADEYAKSAAIGDAPMEFQKR